MNKKRTIIAAIVLLLVLLVGGAIAYFTDETDPVTNTFTLGKVSITLTEPNWVTTDSDNNGVPDVAEKLVPGDSLLKNPTVTVDADSNDAFVFVKVEVPCVGSKEVFTYDVTDTKWTVIQNGACSSETGAAVKVYGYSDANYVALKKNVSNDPKALQNTPFIIWSKDIKHKEVNTILDTADILPTLLNMLGIEYNPMNYIGEDVFSKYHDNFVWFSDGTIIGENNKDNLAKANLNIIKNRNILLTNYYGK